MAEQIRLDLEERIRLFKGQGKLVEAQRIEHAPSST